MVNQRIKKFSSWNVSRQEKSSPFAPRPFPVQQKKAGGQASHITSGQEGIQHRPEGLREPSDIGTHSAAAGITSATKLPHLGCTQANSRPHPISLFKAHVGPEATQASTTIQRYLIVGSSDFTRWHKENPTEDLEAKASEIMLEIEKAFDDSIPAERQMKKLFHEDDGKLKRQLIKWIEHKPGENIGKNPDFGRKNQTRAYGTYKSLAYALLGWVQAKSGRRKEKELAEQVQSNEIISYHLDSILLKIYQWIKKHDKAARIEDDLGNITQIGTNKWNVYQDYFNKNQKGNNLLPEKYIDVLQNPQNYKVRQKTGILHDIMHYFADKYKTDDTVDLVNYGVITDRLPDTNATVIDNMSGTTRTPYQRPKSTQIKEHQRDNLGLVKPENIPGGTADPIQISNEEEHLSYKLARSKGLPMYGRHSFTAARLMLMAQRSGGTAREISAIAWSIMAYWRLNYDHTRIPYHTLHEIMDFLPDFGGNYQVDAPYEGINIFTNEGLISSLRETISSSPNERDINKLLASDTEAHNAAWFLKNPDLWEHKTIKSFLFKTSLPDQEFFALNKEDLKRFFERFPKLKNALKEKNAKRYEYIEGKEGDGENIIEKKEF